MLLNRWSASCLAILLGGTYWLADAGQRIDPKVCKNGLGAPCVPETPPYMYFPTQWRRFPDNEPTPARPRSSEEPSRPAQVEPAPGGMRPPTNQPSSPAPNTPSTLPTPTMPDVTTPPTQETDPFTTPPSRRPPTTTPSPFDEMRENLFPGSNPPDSPPTPPSESGSSPGQSPPTPPAEEPPFRLPFDSTLPEPSTPVQPPSTTPARPTTPNVNELLEPTPSSSQWRPAEELPAPAGEGGPSTSQRTSPFEDEFFKPQKQDHRTGNPFEDEPEPTSARPQPRQTSGYQRPEERVDTHSTPRFQVIADAPPEMWDHSPPKRLPVGRPPVESGAASHMPGHDSPDVTFSSGNPLRKAAADSAAGQRIVPAANWTSEPRAQAAPALRNPLR